MYQIIPSIAPSPNVTPVRTSPWVTPAVRDYSDLPTRRVIVARSVLGKSPSFPIRTSYQQRYEDEIREDRSEVDNLANALNPAYQTEVADHPGQGEASEDLPPYFAEMFPRSIGCTENVVAGCDRQLHAFAGVSTRNFLRLHLNAEQRRKVRYRSSDTMQRWWQYTRCPTSTTLFRNGRFSERFAVDFSRAKMRRRKL